MTTARWDDGRELYTPLEGGRFSAEQDQETGPGTAGERPRGGGYGCEARKPPSKESLAR